MTRNEPTAKPLDARESPEGTLALRSIGDFKGVLLRLDRNGVHAVRFPYTEEAAFHPLAPAEEDPSRRHVGLAKAAARALKGIPDRPGTTVIALPHELCILDILSFPPVPMKHLVKVLHRKVEGTAAAKGNEEVAWSWRVLEAGQPGGGKNTRVLLARMPARRLADIHRVLREEGVRARHILPSIEGPMALIRNLEGSEAEGAFMVVDRSAEGAMISVFKERIPRLVRLVKHPAGQEEETFFALLREEIRRSIAFYKEKFNAIGLDGLFLLGPAAERIFTAQAPPPAPLRYPVTVEGPAKEPDRGAFLCFTAMALAAMEGRGRSPGPSKQAGKPIDFYDTSAARKKVRLLAAGLLIPVLCAVAFFLGRLLEDRAVNIRTAFQALEASLPPLEEKAEQLDALSRLEGSLRELDRLLHAKTHPPLGKALAAVHTALPKGVTLLNLRYAAGNSNTEEDAGETAPAAPSPSATDETFVMDLRGDFTAGKWCALHRFEERLRAAGIFGEILTSAGEAKRESPGKGGMVEDVHVELILR